MTKAMIEVTRLTKRFGDRIAVDHVSFLAKPGEVVGLLGPNGAGKTTTMRMLTGFLPPSEGGAKIAGHDIAADSLNARRNVGYLPERVPVYPDMTVREYVFFWARLRGQRDARARADAVIAQVNLSERRDTLIRNLSKGMRQRLGFAQALVHDPPVLILDEPTIGIDPRQVIEVRDTVRELGRTKTVLFSTHILSEAEHTCDRVIILHQGRIVAQGQPSDLKRKLRPDATLEEVFLSIVGAERGADK
ncbi:MAG: ABC transporter ATP-binding protein [Anaerolineae bacterium]|nr:ABC transporter ATP-binding protein [Anaerolineae bacterium]NUQ02319.1 ABC transporter ATP-binding protein [Anaerolineae bacterium]